MYYTNTLGKDERILILSYKMFMPDTDELVTYSQIWKKNTDKHLVGSVKYFLTQR